MKFIRGHGDADEEHTRDIIEQLRAHVPDGEAADVEFVAHVIGDLYVQMFAEIGRG